MASPSSGAMDKTVILSIFFSPLTGMVSVSEGLNTVVVRQLESMGLGNTVVVYRPSWVQREDGRWVLNRSPANLRYSDALAIQGDAASVSYVLPENSWTLAAERLGRAKTVRVVGTTPEYEAGHNWRVASGRFLRMEDVEGEAAVCVVGRKVADELFAHDDALGAELTVRGTRFRVVGVMQPKGDHTPEFTGTDDSVVVPLTTFRRRVSGDEAVGVFFIRAVSTNAVVPALNEVKATLGRRHRVVPDEAFGFFTSDEIIRQVSQVSFVLKAFLGGVASIALVVGGVGIMNMMLITVTERTQEIGLRKAVGARARHVLYQFLIESVVMGTVGGSLGILFGAGLGAGAALIVSAVLSRTGGPPIQWPAVVSFETAWLAALISASIGIVAGLLPAFRAARLQPTEALHHE